MTPEETKLICRLHIKFVEQEDKIFEQYTEEILKKMPKREELLKKQYTEEYQKLVNERTLTKAVKKYSTLLAGFDKYELKDMDWHVKKKKKLKKDKHRAHAFKVQRELERKQKQKEQSMQT